MTGFFLADAAPPLPPRLPRLLAVCLPETLLALAAATALRLPLGGVGTAGAGADDEELP